MNFLLIDFGASFIKTAIYDCGTDNFLDIKYYKSPLDNANFVSRDEIINKINYIFSEYKNIDNVLFCCILGGGYIGNEYHSWKSSNKNYDIDNDLITGAIDKNLPIHWSHLQHKNIKFEYNTEINKIGKYKNKYLYNVIGYTNCVIESVELNSNDILINLGTGSQIIKVDNNSNFINFKKKYNITSYIPSGRSLNVFNNFFKSFNIDFYNEISKLTIDDLIKSTLKIDLKMFKEALNFSNFGAISNITEDNFNYKNLISSIIKCYIEQYLNLIDVNSTQSIFLTGGISRKVKIISEYIKYKTNKKIILNNSKYRDTHIGMSNIIKKYKK